MLSYLAYPGLPLIASYVLWNNAERSAADQSLWAIPTSRLFAFFGQPLGIPVVLATLPYYEHKIKKTYKVRSLISTAHF